MTVDYTAPGAPNSLRVARHESGKLLAAWNVPDAGSDPTGYTVQWKEAGDNWADLDDVSETDVTGTSHVITGQTDGMQYAVRVIAHNDDAESAPQGDHHHAPGDGGAHAIVCLGGQGHPHPHLRRTLEHQRGIVQDRVHGEGGLHGPGGRVRKPTPGPSGQYCGILQLAGGEQRHGSPPALTASVSGVPASHDGQPHSPSSCASARRPGRVLATRSCETLPSPSPVAR